ncbi:16S rRNA (uracil(1498)-N(3))-methyltransferase [Halocella sp. SP3-1]|uniref:16S rRNA (uracil(1498)-N(3))-methyltransferase n=1 Tax=Halocella sp. SP3-1 TaxID=2382161 RepID=UPI000F755302|nr:16S rRNA (uracil(1498)-N(3))-methyltransferase [Halocella sp. SP3-1]AZO95003.1 16S rRNA (uracil(1498)-N(3))-methyltransferase [Halocella sp. SP3-1]MTI61276.1 16S rRNA (uracil(1498)-N(3))-methyltransferase [Bacillota bacterium]
MHRFFVDKDDIDGSVVRITGSDFNHLSHSLRLAPEDKIIVSNGDGWDYLVELQNFSDQSVKGRIINKEKNRSEPSLDITIAQAIPKKTNMDYIIQKCTELGVKNFIPLDTTRTIVKLKGRKEEKRVNRWQKIAREAAKQAGRGMIPTVARVHKLRDLVKYKDKYNLIIIPWEEEKSCSLINLKDKIRAVDKRVLIIIGPEGGFSAEEVASITKIGGISITLGPRILRTETAGLVTATVVLYETNDLGGN